MTAQDKTLRLPLVSFGATSASSRASGWWSDSVRADVPKSAIISSLLIVGLADNLTDTLSIHIFQESELLEPRAAFRATISNFLTRACIAGSFVVLMLLLSEALAILSCLAWGIALLVCLTYLVTRNRGASVTSDLIKHIAVVAIVIVASGLIGSWIGNLMH